MDVIVARAIDADTALAVYTQELGRAQAQIESNLPPGIQANLDTTNTAGIGDKAATITGTASISGVTVSFTGIYVLSGATFFTIGDLVQAKPSPTATKIQDQAQVTLGRL